MDELRQLDELIAKIKGLGVSSEEVTRLQSSLEKMRDAVGSLSDVEMVKLQSRLKGLISTSEKLIENGNINDDVLSSILEKSDGITASAKNTVEYLGKQTWQYKAISQTLEGVEKATKAVWQNWKEIDDIASKHGRTLGLDHVGIAAYRREMFKMYQDLAVQYGMTNKELVALQQGYTRATGKARLLTKQMTEDLAGTSKIIGQENVDAIAEAMDNLGGSATSAAGAMANISARARAQGLEATKAAKSMAEAMKMSQRYTFKEGVNGMAKMVAHAQSLKVSMQSIESAADKFSTIEGAIQTSAQLQVLGGDFQNSFANPMQMMGLALTDMNEFQDKLLGGFKNLAYFNEKTGRMDMSQLDKMRLQAAAKAAGMSFEDAFNAATQEGLQARIEQSMKASGVYGQLNDQNRAWLKNNAQYNTDTGEFEVQFEDKDGKMQTKAISKLTNEQLEIIKKRGTKEDALRDDVSAIRAVLEQEKVFARDTKSWNEMMEGAETGVKNGLSDALDDIVGPIKTGLNWALKGFKSALLLVGTMSVGKMAWGIGTGMLKNIGFSSLARILGSGGGFGIGGMFGGLRGFGGKMWGGLKAGGKWLAKPFSAAGSATAKYGGKALQMMAKMPKKGKVGLAIGAITALAGGAALASSSKSKGSGATESEAENRNIQEGTELGELQKQTSLLEKLVNGQSETLSKASASPTMDALGEVLTSSSMLSYGAIAGGNRLLTKPPKAMMNAFNSVDKRLGYKLSNNIGLEDDLGRSLTRDSKGVLRVAKGQVGGGKFAKAAKPLGKLGKGANLAAGITMGLEVARGFTEEGSAVNKGLGVASRASEFAGYGALVGAPWLGAAVGALYGATEQYGQVVRDKADEMMEAGGFLNTTGGYLLRGLGTVMENVEDTFDGIGNAIGSVAKAAWKGGRKVLSFATFGLLGGETTSEAKERREGANAALDQMVFERGKIGATSINDSQLMQKAALATISIHDLMVSRWNKEDKVDASDEAIEKHRKKIAKNGFWSEDAGDIFDDYGSSGPTTSIVGHARGGIVGGGNDSSDSVFARLSHGEMVLNQEQQARLFAIANGASEVEARPTGEGTKISKKDFANNLLFGGPKEPSVGPKSIDININGTLKLTGNGGTANFDVKELAKNKEFMDMMFKYITEQMDRKGQLGVGSNKNSSIATRGYGMESNVGMV